MYAHHWRTYHTYHGMVLITFPFPWFKQMWRLYCTYSSLGLVWKILPALQQKALQRSAEVTGSLLVGLAPVEGVIPAAVLPVGILFCERGGESVDPFITASIVFQFLLVIIFQNLAEIGTISHQFQSVTGESTGLGNAHLPQAFMFAVRRKKNEPSRPGLLLLYYSEELWERLNGGGARRGSENTNHFFLNITSWGKYIRVILLKSN